MKSLQTSRWTTSHDSCCRRPIVAACTPTGTASSSRAQTPSSRSPNRALTRGLLVPCLIKKRCRPDVLALAAYTASREVADEIPEWRKVVAVIAGCLLLCNLHRSTFSVLLPELTQQLQLSSSHAGLLQATMLVTYLVGQMPSGQLADKYGGLSVLLVGLCLWSAGTALTAAATASSAVSSGTALALLLLSRVCMGLTSSCAMPCVTAAAVKWVAPEERASTISFIYANFNVGGVVGLSMIPYLAQALGTSHAFLLSGGLGLLWALVGVLYLQGVQPPADVHAVNSSSSSSGSSSSGSAGSDSTSSSSQSPSIPSSRSSSGSSSSGSNTSSSQGPSIPSSGSSSSKAESWLGAGWSPEARQQVAVLCCAHAVMGWGFFIMQNWLPMYVASLGPQALSETGRASSMPWLAGALVGMVAGSSADGLIKFGLPTLVVRRIFQCLCFLGCALSVVPLALTPQPTLAMATACLTANLGFYSFSYGGFHAYLQDVAGKRAGALQGLTNSCSIGLGILGNLTTGWLVDITKSYAGVFWVLAVIFVVAAGAWATLTTGKPLEQA